MDSLQTAIELTRLAIERDPNFTIGQPDADKVMNFIRTVKNGLDEIQATKDTP